MTRKLIALLPILCLPALTTGCLVAAAGAGAAGGYYVAKDERSAGQIAEDAAITGKVKAQFIEDREIDASHINVDTYQNVVTLRGDVPSSAVADRAIRLARSTKGVHSVRSELTVIR